MKYQLEVIFPGMLSFLCLDPWLGNTGHAVSVKTRAQSYQQKNSQNSDKILRFLTISTDFQIVFLSKFSEENIQKSVQPAAPKYFELVRETESGGPKK